MKADRLWKKKNHRRFSLFHAFVVEWDTRSPKEAVGWKPLGSSNLLGCTYAPVAEWGDASGSEPVGELSTHGSSNLLGST